MHGRAEQSFSIFINIFLKYLVFFVNSYNMYSKNTVYLRYYSLIVLLEYIDLFRLFDSINKYLEAASRYLAFNINIPAFQL